MDLARVVGPIILACAILYAIPATAVLGAILVTGFLGGAICAHVRIGELGSPPEIISLLLGNDLDRKSTRLNSSHQIISYAVFSLKKKNPPSTPPTTYTSTTP